MVSFINSFGMEADAIKTAIAGRICYDAGAHVSYDLFSEPAVAVPPTGGRKYDCTNATTNDQTKYSGAVIRGEICTCGIVDEAKVGIDRSLMNAPIEALAVFEQ
jgi:hypothetical protein